MKKNIKRFFFYLLVIFTMTLILMPFLVMLSNSFMGTKEMFENTSSNYHVIARNPTLKNYMSVFKKPGFANALSNSIIISGLSTILTAILATLSAYTISKLIRSKKVRNIYQFIILFISMLPTMAILIPLFIYSANLGLYDTKLLMILLYTAFNTPFAIWIMKAFFDTIPLDLSEAAYIDGCTYSKVMLLIDLPLALPGLASMMIFTFISTWNEFLLAMVLTSKNAQTWSVWVGLFKGMYDFDFGAMLAAGVIGTLPVLIMAQIFQKWIIEGLVSGATKG